MKRREFFEKASMGSAALMTTLAAQGRGNAPNENANENAQHHHGAISGPLATAVVSFGAWVSGPNSPTNVSNRQPNIGATAGLPINVHALIPNEVKIKAGGTVNFIIAGFHLVVVYDDGTEPGQINTSLTVPPFGAPAPPLINDPNGRIYRGIDPTVLPFLQGPTQPPVTPPAPPGAPNFQPVLQDRVEVVHFPNPGRYLVICGVLPHFNEGMYGYVEVIP